MATNGDTIRAHWNDGDPSSEGLAKLRRVTDSLRFSHGLPYSGIRSLVAGVLGRDNDDDFGREFEGVMQLLDEE